VLIAPQWCIDILGWSAILPHLELLISLVVWAWETEGARAPSYFSQFFEQQLAALEGGQTVRTLYIDRDPVTFRDIARHLQGMVMWFGGPYGGLGVHSIQDIMFLPRMDNILSNYMRMRNFIAVCDPLVVSRKGATKLNSTSP
jgi:hypothetical protein